MPLLIRQDDLLLRLVKDVNDIRTSLRRTVANLPLYDISNENTPAQIAADQNNYVPGNFDVLRLYSDAPRTITGFSGGVKGRFLRLFNVGIYEISIANNSLSSLASNRVRSSTGLDIVIDAGGELVLYYDFENQRWISSYASSADRKSVELRLIAAQSIPNITYEEIIWTSLVRDTGGFFDPGIPNLITIPETGWYDVNATVTFGISGVGSRRTLVRSFPNTYISLADSRTAVTGSDTTVNFGRVCRIAKGITIATRVWQDSGGPLNIEVNSAAALGTALIVSKV